LQGTIRENLDPFAECTDEEIDEIVKVVALDKKIGDLKDGL
jgi:ABC-type multidrug transport system fused ATPase/permease subunit